MFHFQLYRACPILTEKKRERPKFSANNKTRERFGKKPKVNVDEVAKNIQNQTLFGHSKNVTVMDETRNPTGSNQPSTHEEIKDLASLHLNFTKGQKLKRTKRSFLQEVLEKKDSNNTDVGNRFAFSGSNKMEYNEESENPDMDYYSDVSEF